MADESVVTKDQVEEAERVFQAAVEAHATASLAYNTVVPTFVQSRKTLRDAYAAEVEADRVLTDLITRYEAQQVPPVPSDE